MKLISVIFCYLWILLGSLISSCDSLEITWMTLPKVETFTIVEYNGSFLLLKVYSSIELDYFDIDLDIIYYDFKSGVGKFENIRVLSFDSIRSLYVENKLEAETEYDVYVRIKSDESSVWSDWSSAVRFKTESRVPLKSIVAESMMFDINPNLYDSNVKNAIIYFKVPSFSDLRGEARRYRVTVIHYKTNSTLSVFTSHSITWLHTAAVIEGNLNKETFTGYCKSSCNLTYIVMEKLGKYMANKVTVEVGTNAGFNDSLSGSTIHIPSTEEIVRKDFIENLTAVVTSESEVIVSWKNFKDKYVYTESRVVWCKRTGDKNICDNIQSKILDPNQSDMKLDLPAGESVRHYRYGVAVKVLIKSTSKRGKRSEFEEINSGIMWADCLHALSAKPQGVNGVELNAELTSIILRIQNRLQCSDQMYGRYGYPYGFHVEWKLSDTSQSSSLLVNANSPDLTEFSIDGLKPGSEYILTICPLSVMGKSDSCSSSVFNTGSLADSNWKILGFSIGGALAVLVVIAILIFIINRACRHYKEKIQLQISIPEGRQSVWARRESRESYLGPDRVSLAPSSPFEDLDNDSTQSLLHSYNSTDSRVNRPSAAHNLLITSMTQQNAGPAAAMMQQNAGPAAAMTQQNTGQAAAMTQQNTGPAAAMTQRNIGPAAAMTQQNSHPPSQQFNSGPMYGSNIGYMFVTYIDIT